jgi:hypothetical protein
MKSQRINVNTTVVQIVLLNAANKLYIHTYILKKMEKKMDEWARQNFLLLDKILSKIKLS